MKEPKTKVRFTMGMLAGQMCASLTEEGKMSTVVVIQPDQQAWFNVLRAWLRKEGLSDA